MMKFFRKHHNVLMIVIAVLAIPFVFYFNKSGVGSEGPGDFATFYNRKIAMVEAQRYAKLLGLATALGMTDFIQDLTFGARDENDRTVEFIFNMLILRRESERLGLDATTPERVDFVRNLRAFNGPSGSFDVGKYTEFNQGFLAPNGLTDAQVEELARDDIALQRIKELVAAGVSVPDIETKENYDREYGQMTASVVHLRTADFSKDIQISDDDVRKFYDSHKGELKTDEQRKVDFVNLALSDDQKKLTGKPRIDALQKLADRATDFSQALLEKGANFQQVAAKFQLPAQTTGDFTAMKPDPKLAAAPQLAATAFQLTSEDPNTEPIQVADGYYILHLAGVTPSRPLTLEEAKPKIVESLTNSRARQALTAAAAQVVHDLREGLKAGEPVSFAAEKAKVKIDKVPPFTLVEDEKEKPDPKNPKQAPPEMMAVRNAVASLQPGEVSDFVPWDDGGIIAVLEKREAPDEAKYGPKKAELAKQLDDSKRKIALFEWLRQKKREAGVLKADTAKG
jgi:hypothetical protein